MTVRELIRELSQLDPDLPVVVDGYEEGYNDPSVCRVHMSERDDQRPGYAGTYGYGKVTAIVVSRSPK